MANVARAGTLGAITALALNFVGQPIGVGVTFSQWESGPRTSSPKLFDVFNLTQSTGGTRTNSNPGTPATDAVNSYPAVSSTIRDAAGAFDSIWFERVHLIPRSKIRFGNIITLVEDEYELYSAFRTESVQLLDVTNNALPGVDLPNLVTPYTARPQSSYLDPTTTSNNLGIGLGTLVKLKIQALQDGLPIFDTSIVFDYGLPATDLVLLVSGQRIVLIPMSYESPLTESLSFATDIIESLDGTEQRIALRKNPRQILEVTYLLDANERQRMNALLFDWLDSIYGIPLWHERVFTTASVSAGATSYQVRGASVCDFRVGGMAVIIGSNSSYDVITIASVTDTLITATSASVNGYSANAAIMPLRIAHVVGTATGQRYLNRLEAFIIKFEVIDNDIGAQTPSSTPGSWSTYNSRVLFDDPNIVEGEAMRQDFPRRVYRVDNITGKVTQQSSWDRSKKGFTKGVVLRNRSEILLFKRLLFALCGSQKAFYIPTFITDDLTVVAQLTIGTATMDITAMEYVRLAQSRAGMNLFKITFTDGTSLVRRVISAATISSTVERLTLDTTWPSTKTVGQVSAVQFYELVRFDTDEFRLRFERIGLARGTFPLIRVFDDN